MGKSFSGHHDPLSRAEALIEMGKTDLAIDLLKDALAKDPESPEVESLLAYALFIKQELQPSEYHVRNALSRDPENPMGHFLYGLILQEQNRDRDAEREYLQAIRIFPTEAVYHSSYAGLLYKNGQVDKAMKIARNALKLDPENEQALMLLGAQNLEDFDIDMAHETFQRSLKYNPESPHAHTGLGQMYLLKNKPEAALDELKESLRIDPMNGHAQKLYLQALKARHPLYALFWRWTLWNMKLGGSKAILFIFGLWLTYNIIRHLRTAYYDVLVQYPVLDTMIIMMLVLYIIFCIYTWVAHPIFNFCARRGWLK